jgi:undecaprenyl-diphosphatase
MNSFDSSIIEFLNRFAGRSLTFDSLMVLMSTNVLLEGGIIVVLFWWAWVQCGDRNPEDRERLLFGLCASTFSVFIARTLALTLPLRLRPLHNPLLNFKLPYSLDPGTLLGWSSFPSDHAVVFFCLAMSLWFVSKRLGAIAIGYALMGVCFPRVYLGIHYPSDILAGAVMGIGVASLANVTSLRKSLLRPVLYWQEHHPASFGCFLFLICFEIAEEFNSLRMVGLTGYHGVEVVLQALR